MPQQTVNAVVWAGQDLYTVVHIPAYMQTDREQAFQTVVHRVMHTLEDDFGQGVQLVQSTPQEYYINVDDVPVSTILE